MDIYKIKFLKKWAPKEKKKAHKSRNQSRASVKIPVQFWGVDDKNEPEMLKGQVALAKDLSLEGLYLKTSKHLEKMDVVRLEIYISQNTKYIYAFAEVVWSNMIGAGLRLLLMSEEDRDSLKKYLEEVSCI